MEIKKPLSPSGQYILPSGTGCAEAAAFGGMARQAFSLPTPLGELLYHRGFRTMPELRDFLYPRLSMLPVPGQMSGMKEAVACLLEARQNGQPVFIHGDYDVDGITSTALLLLFFREIGMNRVYSYIPNRLEEQYGLSASSIARLLDRAEGKRGEGLFITVDCGISALEEIRYLKSLGLRVLVTDHHEPGDRLPEADAVLNPKRKDCAAAYAGLAGVGVVFFLLMGLRKALVEEEGLEEGQGRLNLKKYLDLVALGTVADVSPLMGVNRILVRAGLEVCASAERWGVRSLIQACGLARFTRDHGFITAEDIAFRLAPRINAAGRLGQPEAGLGIFLAPNMPEADVAVQRLEEMNSERKALEVLVLPEVERQCETQVQDGMHALSVRCPECHPGVLGILAAKMANRYRRPVIVFTNDGREGLLKGSGRSVAGINLFELLKCCAAHIEQFGGHTMAIGLCIREAAFNGFREALHRSAQSYGKTHWEDTRIAIDCLLADKNVLNTHFFRALQLLQPFGEGNPEPIFLLRGERLYQARSMREHVVFQMKINGQSVPGICFYQQYPKSSLERPIDLVFHWRQAWLRGAGRQQIQALHLLSY